MTYHPSIEGFRKPLIVSMRWQAMAWPIMLGLDGFRNGDIHLPLIAAFFFGQKDDWSFLNLNGDFYHPFVSDSWVMEVIKIKGSSPTKRGVVYARINREVEKKRLLSQIRCCREEMKRDMVEEVHSPITDISSGRNYKRPGLRELIKLAKDKALTTCMFTT